MRKYLSFIGLLLGLTMGGNVPASAQSVFGLQFKRTGTSGSDVIVKVVDEDGKAITGAAATVSASHAFKGTGGNVTESILCLDVNGNARPTVVLTFTVSGLPQGGSFDNVALDIHALNASGNYQQNNDGKDRQFNVSVKGGESAETLSDWASFTDIDVAAGIGSSGNVHQLWNASSASRFIVGNDFTFQIVITTGTVNAGCFFGLSAVTFSNGDAPDIPVIEEAGEDVPQADKCYYIRWFNSDGLYMTQEADGSLVVKSPDVTQRQFWQFEPAGGENCWYVRNVATGLYLQSCNQAPGAASLVKAGAEPVEYYVAKCETSGSSVYGGFRLTSTDCDNYDNTSATPRGLNKDGASTNIIVWNASEAQTGSWWKLTETENLYDLRPFNLSAERGNPLYTYAILSAATGKMLQLDANGTLSWENRTDTDTQSWYFVGTGNSNGGFLIVNAGTGRTVDVTGETDTRWYVLESGGATEGYLLRPFATRDDASTTLLAGDATGIVTFRALHSRFARSTQIYEMPCGSLGTAYVTGVAVSGEGSLVPMTYPLPKVVGGVVTPQTATRPSGAYTLWTQDKATVVAGKDFDLQVTLNAALETGDEAYAYFDWNRDGVFEETCPLTFNGQTATCRVHVPAEAAAGKSRLRLRITANGLADADDEAAGQILDFVMNVETEMPADYVVTATPNDVARGSVELTRDGAEVTVTASPSGNATFICWREGNVPVSAAEAYTFTPDHNTALTAVFSPNTKVVVDGINVAGLTEESFLLEVTDGRRSLTVRTDKAVRLVLVYAANGRLVGKSTTAQVYCNTLEQGVYAVKVYTETASGSQKILVK